MRGIYTGICLSLLLLLGGGIARGELRTWTDISGKYKYEADFVGLEGDIVQLRLANGKVANIPLEKLCAADREAVEGKVKALSDQASPEIQDSPKARTHTETAEHFSALLKHPGKKDKMLALEGLGKIRLESLDQAEQAEGLELLGRVKEFGDAKAWDEALSTIARYYSQNLKWKEAEQAWLEYVSDKNVTKYSAEAWCMLGLAREKLAGDDKEKLGMAFMPYFRCYGQYQPQIRYSSVAWRRAAEVSYKRGETEKARKLIGMMIDQFGGVADIIDPKMRTDDVKWAQIELKKARILREKWANTDAAAPD